MQTLSCCSRLKAMDRPKCNKMKSFFGIIIWMGLVNVTRLASYWSQSGLYNSKVSSVMSRNKFELLLRLFHGSNNESLPRGERHHKVQPFINLLLPRFQKMLTPQEDMCIDETIIPFRGLLLFRQYVPNKIHRYGVQAFKPCLPS